MFVKEGKGYSYLGLPICSPVCMLYCMLQIVLNGQTVKRSVFLQVSVSLEFTMSSLIRVEGYLI